MFYKKSVANSCAYFQFVWVAQQWFTKLVPENKTNIMICGLNLFSIPKKLEELHDQKEIIIMF